MKANDFVKKVGWDVAIKLSNEMTGITQDVADCVACWGQSEWDYLKRLVASYEVVQSHGGLEKIKEKIKINAIWQDGGKPTITLLKQAIADFESCL